MIRRAVRKLPSSKMPAMRRCVPLALVALAGCGKEPAPPAPATSSAARSPVPIASVAASVDLISSASPAGDAGPGVIGAGRVDGAALRKRHRERLRSDTSPVTILRGDSALALGAAICEAVMPKRPRTTPILLKPNLCGFDGIRDPDKTKGDDGIVGRTTDVEFTRGVVRCLKRRGHSQVTIAEGCGISHAHFQRVIELTGYAAMAREERVALVAMDDDGVYDVEGDKPGLPLAISGIESSRVPNLLLPKILAEHLDHGLFVSLPKIKTHRYSVTSMAIKGMQGTVMLSDARPAYKQKYRMHRELNAELKAKKQPRDGGAAPDRMAERRDYVASLRAFAERMLDVLEISSPDVVLADGAPAMGGDGFWQLYPSTESFAIGGTNPVLVDRVGAELLGLWDNARLGNEQLGLRSSPLIELASKRFGLDLKAPAVEGNGSDLLKQPRPTHFRSLGGFAIHSDSTPPWAPVTPRRAPKPELHAPRLATDAPVIDGRGSDAAWTRATPVSWETDWSGSKTGIVTRARFVWSDKALYALFELEQAGLFVDRSRPIDSERARLYEEDCVEIFFGHDARDPNHYLEIELGPFGHFFDLELEQRGKKSNLAWSSGARIATTQDAAARRATIETLLSAPEIVAALRAGARLPLGLYRMEGKSPRRYLAWSPTRTAKPNFHVPEKFGVLVLD